jgi:hypothetical protein
VPSRVLPLRRHLSIESSLLFFLPRSTAVALVGAAPYVARGSLLRTRRAEWPARGRGCAGGRRLVSRQLRPTQLTSSACRRRRQEFRSVLA